MVVLGGGGEAVSFERGTTVPKPCKRLRPCRVLGPRVPRLLRAEGVGVQGYLACKKHPPRRSLQQHMPRAIWWSRGWGAVSYERGTPVAEPYKRARPRRVLGTASPPPVIWCVQFGVWIWVG